jgi:hypothetical protein
MYFAPLLNYWTVTSVKTIYAKYEKLVNCDSLVLIMKNLVLSTNCAEKTNYNRRLEYRDKLTMQNHKYWYCKSPKIILQNTGICKNYKAQIDDNCK